MYKHDTRPQDWKAMDERIKLPFRIHIDSYKYPHKNHKEWVERDFILDDKVIGRANIPEFYWTYYKWNLENNTDVSIVTTLKDRYAAKKDDENLGSFLIRILGAVMIANAKYHHKQPEWLLTPDRDIDYNWSYTPQLFDGDAHEWVARQKTLFSVQGEDIDNAVPVDYTIYMPRFHWAYHDWLMENDKRDVETYILEEFVRRPDREISYSYEWAIMCIFQDRAEKGLPQPEWIIVE